MSGIFSTDALGLRHGGVISLVGAGGKTSLMFQLARQFAAAGETVLTTTTTKIFVPDAKTSPFVVVAPRPGDLLAQAARRPSGVRHMTAGSAVLSSLKKLVGYHPQDIDALYASRYFKWMIVEADGAARKPLKVPAAHEPVIPASTDVLIAVVGLDAVGTSLTEKSVFRSGLYARMTGLRPGMQVDADSVATALTHADGIMKGCPPAVRRWIFLNKADTPRRRSTARSVATLLQMHRMPGLEKIIIGCAQPQLVLQEIR